MPRSLVMLRGYRETDLAKIDRVIDTDVYRFILATALRLGLVDHATMVWRAAHDEVRDVGGVRVVLTRSFAALPTDCYQGDILFVRGDKQSYLPALRRGEWKTWLFYAADETIVPQRTWGYDVVFVDEPEHFERVKRRLPSAMPARFLKTADPAVFHPLPGVEKIYDVCLFGNMDSPAKNYAALPPIVAALPKLRYVIVGRPEPSLQAKLEQLTPNVHYAGHLPQAEANRVINQSRVGLVLSVHDGAPRTILESMAAGLPQIVNKEIVAGRAYVNERSGIVCPLGDFAEAIERVLANTQAFDPTAVFEREFSPEIAARNIIDQANGTLATSRVSRPTWRRWWNNLPMHGRRAAMRI